MSGIQGKNINRLSINPDFTAKPVEKVKTADLFPEENISTSIKDSKSLSTQSLNSNTKISFVDESLNENNINTSLENFENTITKLVQNSGSKIQPATSREIFNNQVELKKIVLQNKLKTPEDIEHLNKVISPILIELNRTNSLDHNARNELKNLTQGILEKTGNNLGTKIELKTVNDNIIGISTTDKLPESKREVINKLSEMSQDIEKIKSENGKLTPAKILLMGLREELLRHSFESISRIPESIISPEPVYKDMGIISNTVSSIDSMLSETRDLPPNMLSDMQSAVNSIISEPLGQIEKSLNNTSADLIKQNTKFDTPKIPKINGIPNLSGINKANNLLLEIVKGTPRGVGDSVKDAVSSYSNLMNGVENYLPPFLPFPVTLKTPLSYNDGNGNNFSLASGSQISQPNGKGFAISSPGLVMVLNGTNVSSQDSLIQLGNNGIDNLSFGNLNIKDKDNNTNISGFKAEIDRNNGSSFIRAEKTTIDMVNGKVDLTNASLVQNSNGDINLLAESFLYDKDGTHIGFNNFQAGQSEKDGISSLGISAGNIDMNLNSTIINADKFSFNMTHNDNSDITDMTKISAENVNVITGGNSIKADNAAIDLLVNKDGSSSAIISSKNPSVEMLSGKLAVTGDTIISLNQDKNGYLSNFNVKADVVNYTGKSENISVTDGALNIDFSEDNIKNVSANAASVHFDNATDKIDVKDGSINLEFAENNQLKEATAKVKQLDYSSEQGNLGIKDGDLKLDFNDNGNLSSINSSVKNINWSGKNGESINGKDVSLGANFYDNGNLSQINTKIGSADYSGNGNKLSITNGNATVNLDEDGFLKNANGKVDKISYEGFNGDKINASGLDVNINGDKNGLTDAAIKIGNLDYLNGKGDKFNLNNGSASITKDPAGFINNITGKAEKLSYETINGDKINASGLDININGDKNGLTDASIKAGQLDYLSRAGDKVNVTNGAANLTRNAEGIISKITGHADNISLTGKDGNTINANGLNIQIDAPKENGSGYNLSASIKDLNASLKEQKLDIKASGINAHLNDTQMRLHVDSAEVIQKLEKELNVKIENLDVLVDKTKDGNVKGFDLQVAGVDGKIQGMDLQVKTLNGERLRLNMSISDDGKILKEAFLKIPTGGEVRLQKDDLDVKLGAQTIKFSQDGKGLYTFRDDGMNIDAKTKDAKIHVEGGSAQVSLDSKNGNIIIDEIKGTKINAEFGSNKVDVDIKEIKGFIVKATGLSGPVTGAMIELKPTSDNSTMTASISAKVGGLPVKVDFKNMHELKMLGSISENEVKVYAGDPSGRGKMSVSAGPLKLEGSAIEFLARYHTYDSQRMMSSMSRYLSTDGLQLGPLSLEPDGVVRLEKQSSGLHLGASFIMPGGVLQDDNRFNLLNRPSLNDKSWGMIASIGGQGKSADGTNYVGNIYAGLVPGSYVSLDRKQGDMSLFNVPMPSHISLPSTVVGGLGFRKHSDESRLDATVGGFVNPVGLLPKDSTIPLKDQVKYGGFVGMNFRKDNYQVGIDGLFDINKENKVSPSVKFSFSMKF